MLPFFSLQVCLFMNSEFQFSQNKFRQKIIIGTSGLIIFIFVVSYSFLNSFVLNFVVPLRCPPLAANGWRLGVRAGDKLSNSRKTFCEHTSRMTLVKRWHFFYVELFIVHFIKFQIVIYFLNSQIFLKEH